MLLPSAYYEAPILQIHVTEPCTYSSTPDASNKYSLSSYTSHTNPLINRRRLAPCFRIV